MKLIRLGSSTQAVRRDRRWTPSDSAMSDGDGSSRRETIFAETYSTGDRLAIQPDIFIDGAARPTLPDPGGLIQTT